MKSNLKGMSTGTIRKIVQSEQKIKKRYELITFNF